VDVSPTECQHAAGARRHGRWSGQGTRRDRRGASKRSRGERGRWLSRGSQGARPSGGFFGAPHLWSGYSERDHSKREEQRSWRMQVALGKTWIGIMRRGWT